MRRCNIELFLQPKQEALYKEIISGKPSVIGFYGGRGCGKSLCFDMIIIMMMMEAREKNKPISICCVMKNYDQILKFHIKQIISRFPELEDNINLTSPSFLTIGKSTCVFDYGNSEENINRRFRSGNYDYVFVDQAELFEEQEINEIRNTIRSTTGYRSKLVLSFNMRGSGINWLRKWFNSTEMPNPQDYTSIKINPWDNVFWVIDELIEDSYTIGDYFRWTDDQRKQYSILKGQYTSGLANNTNEAIKAADWEGSWDSIEGSYFAEVFDLTSVRISREKTNELMKDWSTHFISQDWGRAHYTVNYWHFRVTLSPSEANKILGWRLELPINIVCTYRESVLNDLESNEIAQRIVDLTPAHHRPKIRSIYVGKDAFDVKDSKNTIALKQSEVMRANGLPGLIKADWSRVGGWTLMAQLLKATKGHGFIRNATGEPVQAKDVWLISADCAQLLESIPKAMIAKDNIEDVEKTDKTKTDIDMDVLDACRYGLKSMLNPKKKSKEDEFNEAFEQASPEQKMLMSLKKYKEMENNKAKTSIGSWRNRFK